MTKEEILALQAENLAKATNYQTQRNNGIEVVPELAPHLEAAVVPLTYAVVINQKAGSELTEEEFQALLEEYGYTNG